MRCVDLVCRSAIRSRGMQYCIMTGAAPLSSSHVACLLALSGAAHRPKLGDFISDSDVIMFFRQIYENGRKA